MNFAYFKNYYTDNRAWVIFALRWFGVAAVAGAVTFLVYPELLERIIQIFDEKFGNNPQDSVLAREIFLQNVQATALALFGGIVFGILAFLIVVFNGFIVGFIVMALLFASEDILSNALYLILGLVPHGVLELPAFLLAASIGMRLGVEWLAASSAGHRFQVLRENSRRALLVFPLIVIILFIAAYIEVYVSGRIVNNF